MKTILIILSALLSLSALADSSSSRGYLFENGRRDVYYTGFTDDGDAVSFDVSFALKSNMLAETQLYKMYECMNKKETHAILLVLKSKRVSVPSGIPGRSTTATVNEAELVDCVRAPGFLAYWRRMINK